MGIFNDDDDDVPQVQMQEYRPIKANTEFPAVNFMEIYDSITGEEFSFIKGRDGSRYLEIQQEIGRLQQDRNFVTSGKPKSIFDHQDDVSEIDRRISELESEKQNALSAIDHNQRYGVQAGDVRIGMRNRQRLPIDLPQVNEQQAVAIREAATVANVTAALRQLGDTIETIENTDPTLVASNQGLINAYREASQRAINRGFDIRRNGLDERLRQMGLDRSSSALGVMIDLQREQTDAEVNNHLQTYKLAQGLKQNTLDNYYKLGQQKVQEGALEMNKFAQESNIELQEREQNIKQEVLKQDRAYKLQALKLQQEEQRNPMRMALPFIANKDNVALGAISNDNNAMHNIQSNQLKQSELEMERWKLEQMNNTNPFGDILTAGLSAGVGALTGGLGTNLADTLISSHKNKQPRII